MQLRPYQDEAVAAIARELERVRATLLVLATGLGKTVTFAAVARGVVDAGGRVLVVAHRGELLDQAAATLRAFNLRVGLEKGAERLDPAELPDVVVASVQTLRGARLEAYAPDAFRLIVIDEAHHATAQSYRNVLEHFGPAKVLGVTATPDRTDGVGLGNVFDSVAYGFELRAGIKSGFLAPLKLRSVVVDALDLSSVRTLAGELRPDELEHELTRDRVLAAKQIRGKVAQSYVLNKPCSAARFTSIAPSSRATHAEPIVSQEGRCSSAVYAGIERQRTKCRSRALHRRQKARSRWRSLVVRRWARWSLRCPQRCFRGC